MVAKGGPRQSSCNAGELDRLLAGRVDIKQYYSGGLQYANIFPVPQSGFRDAGGTWDAGPVRGRLVQVTQTNIVSSLGPHTGTQTVRSYDVAGDVAAIVIEGLVADTGVHTLVVEVYAGGAWTQIGPSLSFGTTPMTRTFARPPGQPLAGASAVRFRVTFGTSATLTLPTTRVRAETTTQDVPRYASLRHDSGARYTLALQREFLDIFEDDAFVAGIYLPTLTEAVLPFVDFYAENATVGIFERTIRPVRLRRAGASQHWIVDEWPLDGIPAVDLGGVYPKTDDVWEIFLRWTSTTSDNLYLSVTVNGETTPAVPLRDGSSNPVAINGSPVWAAFAAELEDALEGLPSLGPGVTVADNAMAGTARRLVITFGGSFSGAEYDVTALVTNTAEISALPVHVEFGDTELEPLFSAGRGWPGVTGLVQDRLGYGDCLAEPGALALSQAAEYFNLNIEAQGASAARLDRLRAGQTAERILAIKDATYLLVFTDQAVHFAANRTISKTDPLNFTITSETGIVANTEPVDLEGKIYFVGQNDDEANHDGNLILSLAYDELASRFDATPESLLASHLIKRVRRTKRQKSGSDTEASRMWMLREDGLLLAAQVIRSQEILGLCRWVAAGGGLVREIEVDARNRLRLCVERGGRLRHERLDPALFLHAVVQSTSDLAGVVSGLALHEGRTVWAVAEGYVLGPFTVASGAIDLGEPFTGPVLVGLFQPAVYETMPRWHIRPNDEIVKRPGRIHTAFIDVIGTTSIAVGANGQTPRDVPLARVGDPLDQPTPAATRKLTVTGTAMLGMKDGTTLTITQTKPGRLQVRDFVLEEKL